MCGTDMSYAALSVNSLSLGTASTSYGCACYDSTYLDFDSGDVDDAADDGYTIGGLNPSSENSPESFALQLSGR